jgi:hypothetical protein
MKKSQKLHIVMGVLVGGIFAFPCMDALSASQAGTMWEYNALTANWEKVDFSSRPSLAVPLEEILHEGTVGNGIFDFWSDGSFQKFLDDTHAFAANYRPNDIVAIQSDFTANAAASFQLRAEAAEQFATMARAFANAFHFESKLSLTSAYRSPNYQKQLASNCSTQRCALPGTSEHEAGLAVDIAVNGGNILGAGGKFYQRMRDNAHFYGFHNTYQKGVEIDGKIVEPWHWRYVGVELATYLHDTHQTLAEYFYSLYPID